MHGDLSGIQHFIYSVASPPGADAHASVHLRGRSFYVGLFVETVAQYLLKTLGLYQPHLLCSTKIIETGHALEGQRYSKEYVQSSPLELLQHYPFGALEKLPCVPSRTIWPVFLPQALMAPPGFL